MKKIDVCLTPQLLQQHSLEGKIVVVIDVLRATSCMVTALAHGVKRIIPVSTLDECHTYRRLGYLTCAERDARKAEGFDLGNSPFNFMEEGMHGKTIAMTTTNGTFAINESRAAAQIIVGSFLNLSAICRHLQNSDNDVVLLCAGWKGRVNAEDTLFAGAVLQQLEDNFEFESDACVLALSLYRQAQPDLFGFLEPVNHVQRLLRLGLGDDVQFCLSKDRYTIVPVMDGQALVKLQPRTHTLRSYE